MSVYIACGIHPEMIGDRRNEIGETELLKALQLRITHQLVRLGSVGLIITIQMLPKMRNSNYSTYKLTLLMS